MSDILQPKINLRDSETIKCEKCGGSYFREVIFLKKVSKLLTGSSEDTTVPFPIYKCDDCGHVNDGFNPFEEKPKIEQ
jgi:predicted nucleic acid-binding Zn ribbon protein